jgi:hypothetical protein
VGLGDRAYNLLRAYIGREWERIEGVREVSARQELDDYLDRPESRTVSQPSAPSQPIPKDRVTESYQVLGLKRSASLADLKRAYTRLSERSLPTNFPEGSDERKKAAAIHLRVQEAYDTLLPILDPRLQRFRSLDL